MSAASAESRSPGAPSWRAHLSSPLASLYVLWLAAAVIYWPSSQALADIWGDTDRMTYTHGYLILLLCLWLVFRKRARLAAIEAQPARWAGVAVLALSALWLWAWRASIQTLHLMLLPLLLIAAVAAARGTRCARLMLFPVGYLYFAIPFWDALNTSLQRLSAAATGSLTSLTGMPVYMQGNLIRLPYGTIEIAGGCSGLHAFIVGLALAALYGEICDDPPARRLLWLAVMGVFSLIVNWLRIFIVAVAAYETEMRSSLVHHHYVLGWLMFLAAFALFLWLADIWQRARPGSGPADAAVGPAEAVLAPGRVRLGLALGALALLPVLGYGRDLLLARTPSHLTVEWPAAPAGWSGPSPVIVSEWRPQFARPSLEAQRAYLDGAGKSIEVFTVAYRDQTQSGKLLGYGNTLLGDKGSLRMQSERTIRGSTGTWRETVAVDPAGARSLIWSRYRIGGRTFTEGRLSQLWYGLVALTARPVSSLTALRAACEPDCSAARERLALAARSVLPAVRLGSAR